MKFPFPENETPKPRWKDGDKVTYKDMRTLPNGYYAFSGFDQHEFTGTVHEDYNDYRHEFGCHRLFVTTRGSGTYCMLECEFKEYDILIKHNAFKAMLLNRKEFKSKHDGRSKYNDRKKI